MGHLHKVRKNICSITKVTVDELMKKNDDPSEDYLPPRQIENREHIVQVTAVKFKDLQGITSSDQKGVFPIM